MKLLDAYYRNRQKADGQPTVDFIRNNISHILWNGVSVKTTNVEDAKKLIDTLSELGVWCQNSNPSIFALNRKVNVFHIGGGKLTRGLPFYNIEGL